MTVGQRRCPGVAVAQLSLGEALADDAAVVGALVLDRKARLEVSGALHGLAREGANGRQGHSAALRGTLSVLDVLDPNQSELMVGAVRSDLIKAWEAQFTTGAVVATGSGTVSFNAADHAVAQALYATLGNNAQKDLGTWCSTNKALLQKPTAMLTGEERKVVEAGNAIVRRILSLSESEGLHAYLAKLLQNSGDNSASNSKALFWLRRDLNESCS